MSRFGIEKAPIDEVKTIVIDKTRISVITDRILRVEHAESGEFVDLATQAIMNRNFQNTDFNWQKNANEVRIMTKGAEFSVDLHSLGVLVKKGNGWTGHGLSRNLKGTYRTLDFSFGWFKLDKFRIRLGDGIFARDGVAEYDDSNTYLLCEDGTLKKRESGSLDKYVFAFGDDFEGGLKEFYNLTGHTPILPKYTLGNWWSRYHIYTQKEYTDLMDKFIAKDMPFTVATIDMDWHLVKDIPKDVKSTTNLWVPGWTGYTFDTKLFPDYKQFFNDLHEKGLAITMNLHPADGVRYFEIMYPEMAKANGIDPASKKPVEFDFTNMKFIETYFDIVHHPYEDEGVNFWWIDWQQGTKSKLEGLDPLWLLNHYHTLDAVRDGRKSLILSRYAGVGSHRYPLGFSGDTSVTWTSLKIQPYFTATASNVGYSWWSHDIGGHILGKGNAELYTRWLQFGVFSPINRLHSNNKSWSKEPWLYGERAEKIAGEFLRLRHRLLPYLYTANVRTAVDGLPIMRPMYYGDKSKDAYKAKNQYYFGTEMIVAPVLKHGKNGEVKVKSYLPEGGYTDFFTGEKYKGGGYVEVTCPLERIPVFVKDGGIVPMLAERNGNSQEFDELEVRVFRGNGEYTMYDEKGSIFFKISDDGKFIVKPSSDSVTKKITINYEGKLTTIDAKECEIAL